MIKFKTPLISGTLIKRYKRFLAQILLDSGDIVTAHCPNPGSMKGLAIEGEKVWLEKSFNPKAKLAYGWRLSELENKSFVVVDTTLANKVIFNALLRGEIRALHSYDRIKPEIKYGRNSRLDFLLESTSSRSCYLEVKSISLADGSTALFPDSITKRGAKHLRELSDITSQGSRAIIFYLVQRTDVSQWDLACDIDEAYCKAFKEATFKGVEVMAFRSNISTEGIQVGEELFRRCT